MYLALLLGFLTHLSATSPQDSTADVQRWEYHTGRINAFNIRSVEDNSPLADSSLRILLEDLRLTRIVLDCPGEAYLTWDGNRRTADRSNLYLALKVPKDSKGEGRLFIRLRYHGRQEFRIRWDELPADASSIRFHEVKGAYFDGVAGNDIAGGAWLRWQATKAWAKARALNDSASSKWASRSRLNRRGTEQDALASEYEIFSSGRAVAENLRLDRVLDIDLEDIRYIEIDSLPGLNVDEIDWASRIEGLQPLLDGGAKWVPQDQYGVFFPSLSVLMATLNEASQSGTPVLNLLDPRSVDFGTRDFYLSQMCLDSLFAEPGNWEQDIDDVTITGSDPYFRTGTDVAVVLHTGRDHDLGELLHQHQLTSGAESFPGTLIKGRDWHYECLRSKDRSICSYVTWGDGVVIVSNSLAQLERVVDAYDGTIPNLLKAPEYTFFRHRYPLKAEDERAFLILTDPTIRRWGSAKWRIGAARRTQALALKLNQRAAEIERQLPHPYPMPLAETPDLTEYGSWQFQTPILELQIDKVSLEEQDQYTRFRERYQRAWRDAFDPIAATLAVNETGMELDITIEPLVMNSSYWNYLNVCIGAQLPADAGDIHPQALMQWAMAINQDSVSFRQTSETLSDFLPALDASPFQSSPLQWVGDSLSMYFDDSPFWDDLANCENPDDYITDNLHRIPFGLDVAVKDRMRLVAFLAGLRGLIVRLDPGSPPWKTQHHREVPYVEITMSDDAREFLDPQLRLFYVILPGHLVFSPRQEVIHAAIDRSLEPSLESASYRKAHPWLGETISLAANKGVFQAAPLWTQARFQQSSWRNLPILNEWRKQFPDRDPVEVHAELWGERLLCPGGGVYRWNEEWKTMESSVYGCPEVPLDKYQIPASLHALQRGDFGLTLQDNALRARVVIER